MQVARLATFRNLLKVYRPISSYVNHRPEVLSKREYRTTSLRLAAEKHEFQVFVRELISNASDALEKRRIAELEGQIAQGPSEIRITTDEAKKTIVFEDTGIGMNRDELKTCLGIIAHSGSKEFIENNKENSESVIGKFGVGFYSAFMVADSVTVTTRKVGSEEGLKWVWNGDNSYEIDTASEIPTGTRIQIQLKDGEASEYAKTDRIRDVINKYSYFVASPILLNGDRVNSLNAIWTMNPKEVSKEMYEVFFNQLVKTQNKTDALQRASYTIHFKTETPVSVRCVMFIPQHNYTQLEYAAQLTKEIGLSLYARRVLIKPNAQELIPNYLRFIIGVVDSEDIPLNLSREMLQNNPVLRKLRKIVTDKVLGFLHSEMRKDPRQYSEFFKQYNLFFKEGVVTEADQGIKEDVAKLLLFESSNLKQGELTSLGDYMKRMQEGQNEIYYMFAHNRQLAESSPYFEVVKSQNKEVLFLYDAADEVVFLALMQFAGKALVPVEKWAGQEANKAEDKKDQKEFRDIDKRDLLDWVKGTLGSVKVHEITGNHRPSEHPVMITIKHEMGAARHFLRTGEIKDMEHLVFFQPTLHVNLTHPLIKSLYKMKKSDPGTAKLLIEQIYDNALITAGLIRDTSKMVARLNKLLTDLASGQHKSTILTP